MQKNPILSSLLRLTVPQLSLEHPFLMRTLLALSALHIAHHSPSRRDHLVSYAIAQHRSASQAAGILLANVTADNCVPVYIFSILTYVFAMATPSQPGDDLLLLNDAGVADWIYLLRGTKVSSLLILIPTTFPFSTLFPRDSKTYNTNANSPKEIVVLNYIYIAASPFGPMFAAGARRHCLRTTDTSPHQPLSTLLSFLRNNANSDISAAESAERMVIYESTIEELRKTFSVINKAASAGDLQVTDISIWVFNTSDEYLALLRDKDNVALVIMSYFCVLLKKLEAHWWMAGRATHILGSIYRLVDAEYRLLMWWPMEELGWLPPGSGEVSRRSSKEYAPWHGRTA